MLVVSAAIVAGSLIGVALPIVLSRTIDQVATAGFSLGAVAVAVVAILLLSLSDWGLSALDFAVSARAVSNVVLRLRRAVFDAVLGHDLSFFDRYPTGGIVSRVLSDTEAFSKVVTMTIDVVGQVVMTVLIFAYLFTVDVPLTLIALVLVPAMFSMALAFRHLSRRRRHPVTPFGGRRQQSRARDDERHRGRQVVPQGATPVRAIRAGERALVSFSAGVKTWCSPASFRCWAPSPGWARRRWCTPVGCGPNSAA